MYLNKKYTHTLTLTDNSGLAPVVLELLMTALFLFFLSFFFFLFSFLKWSNSTERESQVNAASPARLLKIGVFHG